MTDETEQTSALDRMAAEYRREITANMSPELAKACEDGRLLGTGFLQVTGDGARRVDPVTVFAGAATKLRPPPEYADKPWHWLMRPSCVGVPCPEPFEWDGLCWRSGSHVTWMHKLGELESIGYRYLGPAEWRPDAWEPTDADVGNLAIALLAGFCDCPFKQAAEEMRANDAVRKVWMRTARHAFDHPGYLPSIAKARRDHVARIGELEAEIAALKRGVGGPVSVADNAASAHACPKCASHAGGVRYDPVTNRTYGVAADAPPAATARPLPARALRGGDGVPR